MGRVEGKVHLFFLVLFAFGRGIARVHQEQNAADKRNKNASRFARMLPLLIEYEAPSNIQAIFFNCLASRNHLCRSRIKFLIASKRQTPLITPRRANFDGEDLDNELEQSPSTATDGPNGGGDY